MLEIACFNYTDASIAATLEADRLELCEDYSIGGITPNINWVQKIRTETSIPLRIMIRPRGGNFTYTPTEFLEMQNQIQQFKQIGVNGFVFGILTTDNQIDIQQNRILLQQAYPLPCTFHRAFDQVEHPQALQQLINLGFATVLTSGKAPNALTGHIQLAQWVSQAQNHIEILVGGGVRSHNIQQLQQLTQAQAYHSAALHHSSQSINPYEVTQLKQQLLQCSNNS